MKFNRVLIVRADGEMRVVSKGRRLAMDEVAFKIEVTVPDTWGKIQDSVIELRLPEPPEAMLRLVEEAS